MLELLGSAVIDAVAEKEGLPRISFRITGTNPAPKGSDDKTAAAAWIVGPRARVQWNHAV